MLQCPSELELFEPIRSPVARHELHVTAWSSLQIGACATCGTFQNYFQKSGWGRQPPSFPNRSLRLPRAIGSSKKSPSDLSIFSLCARDWLCGRRVVFRTPRVRVETPCLRAQSRGARSFGLLSREEILTSGLWLLATTTTDARATRQGFTGRKKRREDGGRDDSEGRDQESVRKAREEVRSGGVGEGEEERPQAERERQGLLPETGQENDRPHESGRGATDRYDARRQGPLAGALGVPGASTPPSSARVV